jgi:cob(I)alamin adenosyltransferase
MAGKPLLKSLAMGNRLSKIITRTGDTGTTGLGDGSRVKKDSARIEALGAVDELNSWIGLLRTAPGLLAQTGIWLLRVQHDLFDLGGELAIPGHTAITSAQVEELESLVNQLNEQLPPLKEFILPGGSEAAARCHVARTLARRAERRCWTLAREENVAGSTALIYLNRLSDLLFVLARVLARHEHGQEVLWDRTRL